LLKQAVRNLQPDSAAAAGDHRHFAAQVIGDAVHSLSPCDISSSGFG
jgi:hypothetical protein